MGHHGGRIPNRRRVGVRCNFEVNPEYEWATMEAGFPVVARGAQGEIRAIESPTHRFFIATCSNPNCRRPEKIRIP